MDEAILTFLNGFAGQSEIQDRIVGFISANPFFKGLPVAVLFLYLWYAPPIGRRADRIRLFSMLVAAGVALIAGRLLAIALPFRERPLRVDALNLDLPFSVGPRILNEWSSFPSDNAVFFAALATGFWMVRRWAGMLAIVHFLIVIAFARVYLTYHYPSDILGGAVIGAAAVLLVLRPIEGLSARLGLAEFAENRPEIFQPLLFLMLFQVVTMFESVLSLFNAAKAVLPFG